MADNKKIERKVMTYFLCRKKDKKLCKNDIKIYSPFNVKRKGFETDKFDFVNPDYVLFRKGVYELSLAELGDEDKYDQFKEFLDNYNPRGGVLTKGIKGDSSSIKNGKHFRAKKSLYYVTADKKIFESKEKVSIQTKEVKVNTIPRVIAEGMNCVQLRTLAESWKIEIPVDIEENTTAEERTNKYLELLKSHLA